MNQITTSNGLVDPPRLEELARLRLHEDKVDEILYDYVQQAALEFNLPVSLASVVLDGAQFFVAAKGLEGWLGEANGTPVEWSFCATSVQTREPFVVKDTLVDESVKDNPLVKMEGIRCYAGAPMITSKGYVIGNFCVIGHNSREFTTDEISRLKVYAQLAVERIEARILQQP